MSISRKAYLILGMARSGQSVLDFCVARNIPFVAFDDMQTMVNGHTVLNTCADIPWDQIGLVIQSPGIPYSLPAPHAVTAMAQQLGIPIKTDIDLFHENRDQSIPCVGITGTNGKSTTTALITHILDESLKINGSPKRAYMGGNIGVPALSLLAHADAAYYVLELSSYQIEVTNRIDLAAAVLLNVTPDHLDRHGTMANYTAVKKRIFRNAKHAVRGDALVPYVTAETLPKLSCLRGVHNAQNVNAAIDVCQVLGLGDAVIFKGLSTFPGLSHRMEIVLETDQLVIVNDSKGTNAEATERALVSYEHDEIHWIAGGVSKDGGIDSLRPYFKDIHAVYLIGQAMPDFARSLKAESLGRQPNVHECQTLDAALQQASAAIHERLGEERSGKRIVVLFSPACASFDQFKNFEQRGDVFKSLARDYFG